MLDAAGQAVPAQPGAMLAVRGLEAWYGESHILHGVDFDVREGEVVTLLGRNGAGKTTTMKSIMGLVGRRARGTVATLSTMACSRSMASARFISRLR